MKKRKYEILVWLSYALLSGFIAYFNIDDSRKPVDSFPLVKGEVTSIGVCQNKSAVIIRGFNKNVESKVLCFTLDYLTEFEIFKIDRGYDSILQQLNSGDTVEVRYDRNRGNENEPLRVVEIQKGEDSIYNIDQWKAQMNIDSILLMCATLIFFGCWGSSP